MEELVRPAGRTGLRGRAAQWLRSHPRLQAILQAADWPVWVLTALAGVLAYWFRFFTPDDAFITFRYVRNLADGLGFVYNPGQAVLGTTTPFYTLLLALGVFLTRLDPTIVSQAITFLSLWAASLCVYAMLRERSRLYAASAALFLSLNSFLFMSLGMETCFLIGLQTFILLAFLRGRRSLAGALLGLLVLTRYEMAIFALLLAAVDVIQRRRLPWWVLLAAPPVLAWFAYAWATFGSVIPLSASAKLGAIRMPFWLGFITWETVFARNYAVNIAWFLMAVYGIASFFWRRLTLLEGVLIAWAAIYGVAAAFLAGAFPWYYAPLLPALAVLFARGVDELGNLLALVIERLPASRTAKRIGAGMIAPILIAGVVASQLPIPALEASHTPGIVDGRYWQNRQAGEAIRAEAPGGARMMAEEIGIVGYYSNMPLLDSFGLVNPELLPVVGRPVQDRVRYILQEYHPEYLVLRKATADLCGLPGQGYRVIQQYEPDLLVFAPG